MLFPFDLTPSDRCSASLAHSEVESSGTATAAAAATAARAAAADAPAEPDAPLPAALKLLPVKVSAAEGGGSGLNWRISTTAGCRMVVDAAMNSTSTMTGSFQSRPSSEIASAVGAPTVPVDVAPAGAAAAAAAAAVLGWNGNTPKCRSLLVTCVHVDRTEQSWGSVGVLQVYLGTACGRIDEGKQGP